MVKRRRIFGDDFFGFDRDFERMREEMERLMEGMMSRVPSEDFEKLAKKPTGGVYGVSIRIGPEGKPVIREFGNVKPEAGGGENAPISDEREPLVDIIEGKNDIIVIAELPGVEKRDIFVSGEGRELVIDVKTAERKYYKELDLPHSADFANAKAKYNNGVLEVVIQKSEKGSANKKIGIN